MKKISRTNKALKTTGLTLQVTQTTGHSHYRSLTYINTGHLLI